MSKFLAPKVHIKIVVPKGAYKNFHAKGACKNCRAKGAYKICCAKGVYKTFAPNAFIIVALMVLARIVMQKAILKNCRVESAS